MNCKLWEEKQKNKQCELWCSEAINQINSLELISNRFFVDAIAKEKQHGVSPEAKCRSRSKFK